MTEHETIEALEAIGLRGDPRATGAPEWRRVFIIDPDGVTQGRISIHNGAYSHAKWYVDGAPGQIPVPDERWPWAWRLWIERRERLDVARWNTAVQRALKAARVERAEKQAWRDAHPKKGKRQRLELNVGRHLAAELLGQ